MFIYTNLRKTAASIKTIYPTAHLEVTRNPRDSAEYCKKEDTRVSEPIEWGVFPLACRNSNAKALMDIKTLADLYQNNPTEFANQCTGAM